MIDGILCCLQQPCDKILGSPGRSQITNNYCNVGIWSNSMGNLHIQSRLNVSAGIEGGHAKGGNNGQLGILQPVEEVIEMQVSSNSGAGRAINKHNRMTLASNARINQRLHTICGTDLLGAKATRANGTVQAGRDMASRTTTNGLCLTPDRSDAIQSPGIKCDLVATSCVSSARSKNGGKGDTQECKQGGDSPTETRGFHNKLTPIHQFGH